MTDLNKIVKRRTSMPVRLARRKVVIMLMPGDVIGFRDERRRQVYTLPIERAYVTAVNDYACAERARKKLERKNRKELLV